MFMSFTDAYTMFSKIIYPSAVPNSSQVFFVVFVLFNVMLC